MGSPRTSSGLTDEQLSVLKQLEEVRRIARDVPHCSLIIVFAHTDASASDGERILLRSSGVALPRMAALFEAIVGVVTGDKNTEDSP